MQPAFPNFKKLTLDDREMYSRLISAYTPFSDISFTTLHVWWDLDEKLYFSVLNENLVINYSQPFDRPNAGLTLIGHHEVDESIKTLFDYLRQHNRHPKLVHVPEFVVEKIKHKAELDIQEESDMHEYIMDARAVAELDGPELGRIRRKVNRFLREVDGRSLEIKVLDLASQANRDLLFNAICDWQKKYPKANDPKATENQAIETSLKHHRALEIKNLCLFVDGQLQGVVLYHASHDGKYYILNHLKVDYEVPFIFDYLTNQMALKTVNDEIPYLNMEMDLGIEGLRQHKLGLRPVSFFKKYTLKPSV